MYVTPEIIDCGLQPLNFVEGLAKYLSAFSLVRKEGGNVLPF